MAMNFSLNDNDRAAVAEHSFGGGGSRITEPGAYVGVITQAYEIKSNTSESKGVRIDFKSFTGDDASTTFWTYSGKTQGPVDFQVLEVKALMALLGLDSLKSTPDTTIEVYDFDLKKTVKQRVDGYPQLFKKKIGIVWDMEEYPKNDGGTGTRAAYKMFFHPDTRQSANEYLNGIEAVAVDKLLEKMAKAGPKQASQVSKPSATTTSAPTASLPDDDYIDDIPF